jgi:ubiquitin-activating enzyme E1
LFESGTLGTKCHSQIIIPNFTQSYTDIVDPPEETIPLCTLKNFPYQIEHTIQWAREYFEGVIAKPSNDLKSFYENKKQFLDSVIS